MKYPTDCRDFRLMHDASKFYAPCDGIFQFMYNGFQISTSTSGMSQGSCQHKIMVFTGDNLQSFLTDDGFDTVEDAIDFIHSHILGIG